MPWRTAIDHGDGGGDLVGERSLTPGCCRPLPCRHALQQDYYFGWLWVVTVVALALTMVALWLCQGGLCFDYMACGSSHYWSSCIEALAVGLALELLLIIALCSVPASLG
jgi:hypothetical protein